MAPSPPRYARRVGGEGTADVVVAGGGIVGAAVARSAAVAGARVILVDPSVPGAASPAGAGILSPETWGDPDDGWYAFGRAAGSYYDRLLGELAERPGPATGHHRCGLLVVARTASEVDWFEDRAALAARRGADLEEVGPDEVARAFPPFGTVLRALWNPRAARVDGGAMASALAHDATARGVRRLDARVTGLSTAGGRVTGVTTSGGSLSAGLVVVAAGAWSGSLLQPLGVALAVSPLRGQIVHLRLPGTETAGWPIIQPVASFYLVPWPDGRVVCGGTLEASAGFDARATAGGVTQLLRECGRIAPGLADATFEEVRVGLRPASHDDRPLLGPVAGWEGLHVATGHGTEGLLLGPWSGHLVAAAALEGRVPAELAPFDPGRVPVSPVRG